MDEISREQEALAAFPGRLLARVEQADDLFALDEHPLALVAFRQQAADLAAIAVPFRPLGIGGQDGPQLAEMNLVRASVDGPGRMLLDIGNRIGRKGPQEMR